MERSSDRGHRLGRPPKPTETVRSQRVVTFVTPAELEQLERLAERWSTSLSGAVHRLVRRALETESHASGKTAGRTS